jgi:hypothetical protein
LGRIEVRHVSYTRMKHLTFRIGDEAFLESVGPSLPHGVVFESDGESGYFYAVDVSASEPRIFGCTRAAGCKSMMTSSAK